MMPFASTATTRELSGERNCRSTPCLPRPGESVIMTKPKGSSKVGAKSSATSPMTGARRAFSMRERLASDSAKARAKSGPYARSSTAVASIGKQAHSRVAGPNPPALVFPLMSRPSH